jgi:hypothetical protein
MGDEGGDLEGRLNMLVVIALTVRRVTNLQEGGFCISPRKGAFQSRGCKTYRKKKAFRTYVLQQQKWRKSGLRPVVA